jgi:hypothetical protein
MAAACAVGRRRSVSPSTDRRVHKRTDRASCADVRWFTLEKRFSVLYALVVIFLVLWLLGVTMSYTFGGLIHILLVAAVVVMLLRLIQGRNPVRG